MTQHVDLPIRAKEKAEDSLADLHFDDNDIEDGAKTPTANSPGWDHQQDVAKADWPQTSEDDTNFKKLPIRLAHAGHSELAAQILGLPDPGRPNDDLHLQDLIPQRTVETFMTDNGEQAASDVEGNATELLLDNNTDPSPWPSNSPPARPNSQDWNSTLPIQPTWSAVQDNTAHSTARAAQQKAQAEELSLRLSNEFEPVKEVDWDTVVYIGPPSQQHGQPEDEYRCIQARFSMPHLLRSETLRQTGSSEFLKRLGPMSARAARKLKNLGLHQNLPQDGSPKYWIDLRPMQNDEEALLMVAELTCTTGILSWYKSAATRGVDRSLVCGRDDVDTSRNPLLDLIKHHESVGQALLNATNGPQASQNEHKNATASGEPQRSNDEGAEPEYSPIRHHVAIERLLHAIVGNSPRLNSAPKMWNFFAIAKFFDCATLPRVCDQIHSWIFAGYNCDFIEMNPEICYRIALGTQSRLLLRVTFSILVGEKALDQALKVHALDHATTSSPTFSRPFCHLDDDEINRIDHAAQSLQRRIRNTIHEIFNMPLTWMCESQELMKLFALVGADELGQKCLDRAWSTLRQYVRTEMLLGLSHNLAIDERLKTILLTHPGSEMKTRTFQGAQIDRYNALPVHHRLLTQVAWWYLHGWGLDQNFVTALYPPPNEHRGISQICPDLEDHSFSDVGKATISARLQELNTYIDCNLVNYPKDDLNDQTMWKSYISRESISWSKIYKTVQAKLPAMTAHLSHVESDVLSKTIRDYVGIYSQNSAGGVLPATIRGLPGYTFTEPHIDLRVLLGQLNSALRENIRTRVLKLGYIVDAQGIEADIPTNHVDTLLCLNDEEYKYLPLWADGCDDGTGGVFTEAIPGTEEEFSGGKRGLGLDSGLDGLDDIEMGEEAFTLIGSEEIESTVARASKVATDGTGTASVLSMEE